MSHNPARTESSPPKPVPGWRVAVLFIAGCFGVVAFFVAFGLRSDLAETRAQWDRFTALPAWPDVPPDGLGLIEGEISDTSPADSHGFVGWVREAYRSDGVRTSSKWELAETMTQPFLVATSAGPVQITNADYRFDEAAGEWSHETREIAAPTLTSGAVRMRGLLPRKPVTIIGRRTSADTVAALSVAGMSRANYLTQLAARHDRVSSSVVVLFIAAPLAIAYAIWEIRRVLKTL